MNRSKRSLVAFSLIALVAASAANPIMADDDDQDHELARKALADGRIRPLTEIIDSLKIRFPGQIVGVELKAKGADYFIYEFKVLAPDGRLKEVKVDAVTAKIVKVEDDD